MSKAIVLLSGGMDSSTMAAMVVKKMKYKEVHAISYDYGQRHKVELEAAKAIAKWLKIPHKIIKIDLNQIGGSPLTDKNIKTPKGMEKQAVTVVPARNAILLALAAGYAGTIRRRHKDGTWDSSEQIDLVYGPNLEDYNSYPDCRPDFVRAISKALAFSGEVTRVITPLINLNKKQILEEGFALGVPFEKTHTCYNGKPSCGECPACIERENAFTALGKVDPLSKERK